MDDGLVNLPLKLVPSRGLLNGLMVVPSLAPVEVFPTRADPLQASSIEVRGGLRAESCGYGSVSATESQRSVIQKSLQCHSALGVEDKFRPFFVVSPGERPAKEWLDLSDHKQDYGFERKDCANHDPTK